MKPEYWLVAGLAIVGLMLWGQAHAGCTDCQGRFASMLPDSVGAGKLVRPGYY